MMPWNLAGLFTKKPYCCRIQLLSIIPMWKNGFVGIMMAAMTFHPFR